MSIRSGSIILKEIDTIISENPDTKPVLKCCQRVENCVLGLLRKAYSGENIVNLIDAYRRESKQN